MARKDRRPKAEIVRELLTYLGKGTITVDEYRKRLAFHGLRDEGRRGDDVDLYLRGLLK